MTGWTVEIADRAEQLVAASDLFDREVTLESAEAFLQTPGHLACSTSPLTPKKQARPHTGG